MGRSRRRRRWIRCLGATGGEGGASGGSEQPESNLFVVGGRPVLVGGSELPSRQQRPPGGGLLAAAAGFFPAARSGRLVSSRQLNVGAFPVGRWPKAVQAAPGFYPEGARRCCCIRALVQRRQRTDTGSMVGPKASRSRALDD